MNSRIIYFAQHLLEHVSKMVEDDEKPDDELIDSVLRAEVGVHEADLFHVLFRSPVIRFYNFEDELVYTFYIHDENHQIDLTEMVLSFQERQFKHADLVKEFTKAWNSKE